MLRLDLPSLEHTAAVGELLGRMALAGDILLLSGPMGAGKTTLTQSVGRGLGVPREHYITSPTYSLMHEYPGRIPLYHIDCYRLEDEEDVEGSGLMDYIMTDGLAVVEWPDRLGSLIPASRLDIELVHAGDAQRSLIIVPHGSAWQGRMEMFERKICSYPDIVSRSIT